MIYCKKIILYFLLAHKYQYIQYFLLDILDYIIFLDFFILYIYSNIMSKINKIHAREILDSRGNPTVETEIILENTWR